MGDLVLSLLANKAISQGKQGCDRRTGGQNERRNPAVPTAPPEPPNASNPSSKRDSWVSPPPKQKTPKENCVGWGRSAPHRPTFWGLGGGVVVQTELIVSWDKAPKLPTWVDFEGRGNASLQYMAICLHGQLGADPKPPDLHTRPHNHPPQTSTQGPITAPKRAP